MNDRFQSPKIWALLIGIDCYMPATVSGIPRYGTLRGCVNDIRLMEDLLRSRWHVPSERIFRLTASGSGETPSEPFDVWPTRSNIVGAFRYLAEQAMPGDQVYIHYAGHGGRAVTVFPELKGKDGLDESIVPTDYGQIQNLVQPEDRYLRDLDLATLLQGLVDRGLFVTMVLDSCHSGGATRGTDEDGVRGSDEVDYVPRTRDNLVRIPASLRDDLQDVELGTRSAQVASGWVPGVKEYTLIAACRALELAREYKTPNGETHGALTYWLWNALQSSAQTWDMAHRQVVAKVHGRYSDQTPQLQGAGDRLIFGSEVAPTPMGATVMELAGNRLRLDVGQAGAVGKGAQYFIYPAATTDFGRTDERLAVVEVEQVLDGSSWARLVRMLGTDIQIESGDQAILFDPGHAQRRSVWLVPGVSAPESVARAALDQLTQAIQQGESRFVTLAQDQASASFQVGVTADPAFEIRDAGGQISPIFRLFPSRHREVRSIWIA